MKNSLFSRIFALTHYRDPLLRRRAIGTYATASLVVAAGVLLLALMPIAFDVLNISQRLLYIVFEAILIFFGGMAIWLTGRGRQVNAAYVLTVSIVVATYASALIRVMDARAFLAITMALITLSSYLIGGAMPWMIALTAAPWFVFTFATSDQFVSASWLSILALYLPALLIHTVLAYLSGQSLPRLAQQAAEIAAERRIRLSEASTRVSQRLLAARLDQDGLVREITKVVKETFTDVDYVQIFLTDATRANLRLVASTYEENELPELTYAPGSLSLVGRASIGSQPVITRDTDMDTSGELSYMRSGFLPATRTEVAVPMRLGNEIVGVLDLHSSNPTAFQPEDIRIFETLAYQVAVAVDNARLFGEAQRQAEENKHLYDQTRSNLREIERLNRQLTGAAWSEYLSAVSSTPAYTVDLVTGIGIPEADWTSAMAEATRRNQPVVRESSGTGQPKIVSVPISVRGQVIGAMEFELPAYQPVSLEQLIFLQQSVESLGLTAENARLFEDTQRAAHRESLVNEISTRVQSMTSVDAVVATAAQTLSESIRARRVAIRLGTPDNLDETAELVR
ncbi:MAG: GAF domain-containing protein [Anaerolineae bacterium]|nr:GAF domain-containing protein [Anaerolineae bacterium]